MSLVKDSHLMLETWKRFMKFMILHVLTKTMEDPSLHHWCADFLRNKYWDIPKSFRTHQPCRCAKMTNIESYVFPIKQIKLNN